MIILKLHTIGEGIEGISPTYGAYMAECAAVCFESQGHKSGVLLPYSDGQARASARPMSRCRRTPAAGAAP